MNVKTNAEDPFTEPEPGTPGGRAAVRPIKEIEEMRRLSERLANDPRYQAMVTNAPQPARPVKERKPMSEQVKGALMLGVCIIMAVGVWCIYDGWKTMQLIALEKEKMQQPSYSAAAGGNGLTFIVDRNSGSVWRYYLNYDKQGQPSTEGLTPLNRK